LYGEDTLTFAFSKVTDAVIEQIIKWQFCELDTVYLIAYLDCILLKIRQDKQGIKNPFTWPWASTLRTTKNCWTYGYLKTKAPSSSSVPLPPRKSVEVKSREFS